VLKVVSDLEMMLYMVFALLFFGLSVFSVLLMIKVYDKSIQHKKSPLNIDLLRSPGESLQKEIHEITHDLLSKLSLFMLFMVLLYMVFIFHAAHVGYQLPILYIECYMVLAVLASIYTCFFMYRKLKKRNLLQLGLECEVAVGQDLQSLLARGFKVYHDFQATDFNIDHIVVGPTGVFSIETKGRSKSRKAENDNWKVSVDDAQLKFPYWTETKPLEQAHRQAKWLNAWLKKSTGENIAVKAVLALPGWFVERTGRVNTLIYNGKNPESIVKGKNVLTEKQIAVIAFQIEQRCVKLKSKSYEKLS